MLTKLGWSSVVMKFTIAVDEFREAARKHDEPRAKMLCIAFEAALQGPITGEFVFDSDINKTSALALKEMVQPLAESNAEVELKADVLASWVHYFSKQACFEIPLVEALTAMELLVTIYRIKRSSFKPSIINAIFNEANRQVEFAKISAQ